MAEGKLQEFLVGAKTPPLENDAWGHRKPWWKFHQDDILLAATYFGP